MYRQRLLIVAMVWALVVGLVGAASAQTSGDLVTVQFVYNGTNGTDGSAQKWVVPNGVSRVRLRAWGARGGRNGFRSAGGLGAYARGWIAVTPGETLYVLVGGTPAFNNEAGAGGFNGGGAPGVQGYPLVVIPAGGGGASDVRQGGRTLDHRVVVAGGGGGAGAPASRNFQSRGISYSGGVGGDSGAPGGAGLSVEYVSGGSGGQPGTDSAGGEGGVAGGGGYQCAWDGQAGELGQGGASPGAFSPGGGGGGGLYGGGSGGSGDCTEFTEWLSGGGGGGGGSSLAPLGGTIQQAVRTGHGRVDISYYMP